MFKNKPTNKLQFWEWELFFVFLLYVRESSVCNVPMNTWLQQLQSFWSDTLLSSMGAWEFLNVSKWNGTTDWDSNTDNTTQ